MQGMGRAIGAEDSCSTFHKSSRERMDRKEGDAGRKNIQCQCGAK